jgi:Tfp pilus assembly protein PilF
MTKPRTSEGLANSARFLEAAIKDDPANPLATYVLGHIYRAQGKLAEANKQFKQGYDLYVRYGFVPDGPKTAYEESIK